MMTRIALMAVLVLLAVGGSPAGDKRVHVYNWPDYIDKEILVEFEAETEGAQMWFDMMAIPAGAPHPDNAHRFIDYLMRPEVIAKASNHVFYANGNAAATALLNREMLEDPGIHPPPAVRERLYVTHPYPAEAQRFVTSLWNRIKSGQ